MTAPTINLQIRSDLEQRRAIEGYCQQQKFGTVHKIGLLSPASSVRHPLILHSTVGLHYLKDLPVDDLSYSQFIARNRLK